MFLHLEDRIMSTYQKRIWRALAVQLAGAVAAVAAILLLGAHARQMPLALVIGGLILAGVVVLAAGQPWWRRIDEMEREEHALAWYEGSLPGALFALLCLLGVMAHSGAHRELGVGAAICFAAQALFYFIFWGIRRAKRQARGAGS
jgi:FtsH-binding integral membrane protein